MLKDPELMPGMFARLALPLGSAPGLLIPQDAVHTVGQLTMVKVLVDGQTAQLAPGEAGAADRRPGGSAGGVAGRGPDNVAGE